jgi:hypothetical protein
MAVARLPGSTEPPTKWPNAIDLPGQTGPAGSPITERVIAAYLQFRRDYYHDQQPSLSTPPPSHNGVQQAEAAQVADRMLRLIPGAIKAIPGFGGMLVHLEQVVNIHSMSEAERTELHNATMFFLHGVGQGIQPWYLEWLLASAKRLSDSLPAEYFMRHPWDALYYQAPVEQTVLEAVVRDGNVSGAKREIEQLGERLIQALENPIKVQSKLAFTGPDSEAREARFSLLTAAALAFGGFLIADGVRIFLHQREEEEESLQSRLAPLPPEMAALLAK